ncbi:MULTISPECIES: flagellar biosynthetic protein FliQ [Luteimonas]|uniref:flagellar biosynthetic protein FliQ n=1 Tax=Luteimonas TaxID=83614 RepID=UPI000C7B2323|nr:MULTISPECIES: flagellar biosynthetic protein FliQ [Luteimonas]
MTPELALTELRRGLEVALWVGGPLLATVLVVGVVVGVLQAATQVNEPTIAFVAKAIALTAALFALGAFLIGYLVDYTITLFHNIPHLIG